MSLSKKAKIKIKSVIYAPEDECDTVEFSCDGEIYSSGSTTEVIFTEELSDDDVETRIAFSADDPLTVTMTRDKGMMAACSFSKGCRYNCVYDIDICRFEFCVNTHNAVNTLTFARGGSIELDYSIELRGTELQRVRYRLTAVPEEN